MEVSEASDDELWGVCRKLASDFEPYGQRKWQGKPQEKPDCSRCRWFQPLLRPGQLDWGTCANQQSPRAGVLTIWEQGCEQFEKEKEPGTAETRRTRSEFKDKMENILRDALAEFTKAELAKVNRGFPDDEFHIFRHEDMVETILSSQIPHLLRQTSADFDRLHAAEEVVMETSQDSSRFWQLAKRSLAKWRKCDASTIRFPNNMQDLEQQFWSRLRAAFTEALEQKE
jgi:hypothetical protein